MKKNEIKCRFYYLTGYASGEIDYKDDIDKAYKLKALSRVLRILSGERTNEIK